MRYLTCLQVLLLGLLVSAPCHAAEGFRWQLGIQKVAYFDDIPARDLGASFKPSCKEKACTFHLYDPITAKSVDEVEAFLASRPPGASITVYFSSRGGDVEAAMVLGRLLRRHAPILALVLPYTNCESACVLAMLGATHRQIAGGVGIHRPYSLSTKQSTFNERQGTFRTLEASIRDYLVEMNIPVGLLDEMLRYEAESMHHMSAEELSRFRIQGADHVWQDLQDTDMARRYGTDKRTYLQRKVEADKLCELDFKSVRAIKRWQDCRESVLRGK